MPCDVAIYLHAKGEPKRYVDSAIASYYYCSYDASGDLFLDGTDSDGGFRFAELPKDATKFTNISLEVKIESPAAWSGMGSTSPWAIKVIKFIGSMVRVVKSREPSP